MWAATGEPLALPLALATGVLIDADHLIDHFDSRERGVKRHMWRPLHAWEYVAVGVTILAVIWPHPLFLAALLRYISHVVIDQVMNETHPLAYLIAFRIKKGFRRKHLSPRLFEQQLHQGHGPVPLWAKVEPTVWKIVSKRRRNLP